jgi:hypothetical protein
LSLIDVRRDSASKPKVWVTGRWLPLALSAVLICRFRLS